jgi:hypothetical protein
MLDIRGQYHRKSDERFVDLSPIRFLAGTSARLRRSWRNKASFS